MKPWTLRSVAEAQAVSEVEAAQAVPEVAGHPLPEAGPVAVPLLKWAAAAAAAAMRLLKGVLIGW